MHRGRRPRCRPPTRHRRRRSSRSALRRFAGVRPKIVVALGLRQTRWHFLPMEEVAHDLVGDGPVVTVDAVMMWAEARVSRQLQATRSTEAHAQIPKRTTCQPEFALGEGTWMP